MIRSLLITVVSTVTLFAATPGAAQPAPKPIPVSITGGTPGVSIEFFLNSAKLADATANTTGGVDWVLDLSNMGKTRMTIYVDVCKDGKVVKVLFVSANGEPPPKDEDCDRRLVAVSFESDCGVIRITLDLRSFGGRVVGCGLSFRDPKLFGPVIGGIVAVPLLLAGGGSGSPTAVSTVGVSPPPSVTAPTTPPASTTPPTNTTPPAPPPPVTIVTVTPRFVIVLVNHPAGASTSLICGIMQIDPPVAGVTWVLVGSGPGVLPNQNISGTFNANGQASFRLGISQTGQYTLTLTTNNQGQTQTVTFPVNVGAQSFNCPTVS